jgi:hypothetical protein
VVSTLNISPPRRLTNVYRTDKPVPRQPQFSTCISFTNRDIWFYVFQVLICVQPKYTGFIASRDPHLQGTDHSSKRITKATVPRSLLRANSDLGSHCCIIVFQLWHQSPQLQQCIPSMASVPIVASSDNRLRSNYCVASNNVGCLSPRKMKQTVVTGFFAFARALSPRNRGVGCYVPAVSIVCSTRKCTTFFEFWNTESVVKCGSTCTSDQQSCQCQRNAVRSCLQAVV